MSTRPARADSGARRLARAEAATPRAPAAELDERARRLLAEAPCTDLHAHPALKAFLFGRDLRRHYRSGHTFNPFGSRSDFAMLRKGGVRALGSSLHVPERNWFHECLALRLAALVCTRPRAQLWTRGPAELLLAMMDAIERQAARSAHIAVARSNAELDAALAAGRTALVHTVEGAHHLEGDLRRLEGWAARGVASLTLAHLFPNRVGGHVQGVPSEYAVNRVCRVTYGADPDLGLTGFGRELVQEMVRLRVVVDVTHLGPRARAEVLALVDGRAPVIASHVGARALRPDPYNLDDDEIREVARGGGAVGVIFMTRWLDPGAPARGLDAVARTLEHVALITGSHDHGAVGTDFDGFTDPPDDLADASRWPALVRGLLERGWAEDDVRKVAGANARRVWRRGWR